MYKVTAALGQILTTAQWHQRHSTSCEHKGCCLFAGRLSWKVLSSYINAMGGKLRFSILMSWFLIVEAARVSATVWLSYWTDSVDAPGGAPHGPLWYLMIYTIISGIQVGATSGCLAA